MNGAPSIAISSGDPGGVGPNISVRAALGVSARVRTAIFGDLAQLRGEARALGAESALVECDERSISSLPPGAVGVVDTGRVERDVIARHEPCPESGQAQLRTLERAARCAREGGASALVTGPASKAAISSAGHVFSGQTEFLARLDGRADDAVTMLFLGPRLRVALVTTHLALAHVPNAISAPRVARSVRHLAEALVRLIPERARAIAVAGLNPHAGEAGLFGSEERALIEPALSALRGEAPFRDGAVTIAGPTPAETAFRAAQRGDLDGVVAMFHDQATIASKLLDWGAAVNTTWGLSFLRTSVDHGVAYDAARAGRAEAEGMAAAIALAVRLSGQPDG